MNKMIWIISLIMVVVVTIFSFLGVYCLNMKIHLIDLRLKYLKNEENYLQRVIEKSNINMDLLSGGYFQKQCETGMSLAKVLRRWEVDRQYVEV
jgi:hypothetical protein